MTAIPHARTTPVYRDLVPADVRAGWRYPDRDLYTLFARQCLDQPDKIAVIDADGELTYAELDDMARRLAAGLARLGIEPGEVVAVQLPNGRLACAADLAIAALGAIALPYPVGRGQREAASLLGRSRAVAVITVTLHGDFACAAGIRNLAAELPDLRAVIAVGTDTPAGCVPIHALLAADARSFRPARPDPNAPARILVTSGSEAEPKMVAYSHNALAGGRGTMLAELHDVPADMRNLFLVPLATAFGSSGTSVTLATLGGTLLLQPKFDAAATLRLIGRARPTHLLGVATMLRQLASAPELASADLSSLRAVVIGGAVLDEPTARRGREALGCPVINLYGSADGVSTHTALDDPVERVTTAGRPNPGVAEIRVVDEHLEELPIGEVGELIARGPMSPLCYVGAPELDARYRTPDGWVRTGDLGRIDDEGYLTIVGRRKDVIIRGGMNISPAEVEAVLITHPAIRDVACVPVPDPLFGERLCACVASETPLSLDDLTGHLERSGLERRKFPERLVVLPSLPLGPAGKVDRRVLRALAVEHREFPVIATDKAKPS
ncbi:AMP-binding protein [Amycolatopsis umgeniensis]|uniref:Non-ribosomal peptide synthetase component E (Peptide arylation enzyme) n=1 Tax=Amycolatopsis umgeniensis TaxID=336628 RepID=A0A841B0E8_9PSEU|nr:class I adenylate-forming enzyme family protein [Amycolatopsis umgeniensis]MBB5852290.1 non-ribosomal peptide synthetase component E (peptide arylation enzyme) [Amycolatopsis umgeniensis]